MTNTDERAANFLARLIRLEQERRDNAEDRKELGVEMKDAELLKEEIAGIKLAVKRHFEDPDKRKFRESAEEFAAALGGFADTPLGNAAVHVRNDPGVRRAMKQSKQAIDRIKAMGADVTLHAPGMEPVHIKADASA